MMIQENKGGYEYLSIDVKKENVLMHQELYSNFGWELFEINKQSQNHESVMKINLKFRRKIQEQNSELVNLQQQASNIVHNMEVYNRNKVSFPNVWSLICATMGALFVGLAIALVILKFFVWFCVVLIVGVGLIVGTIFVFYNLKKHQDKKYNPKLIEINQQLEQIYQKAKNILGNNK